MIHAAGPNGGGAPAEARPVTESSLTSIKRVGIRRLGSTLLAGLLLVGPAWGQAEEDLEPIGSEDCAGCHETGMLGAPVSGDAADWGARSQLWDAVLLDHAITGYFEMPAKGGRVDLPDDVVKAAAEYMLRMTFPDMQHDCNPPACSDVRE